MVPFRTARSWCVSTFVLVIVAISSSRALAQTTLNPTTAVFSASSDQTTTLPDGTPVLQYYQLDLYLSGASAPFQSNSLGKPAPDSTGTITVDLRSMFAGWPVPGTVYVADVAAVGPGGSAASALSNTFGFTAACTYSASPTLQSFGSSGGSGSVAVTASSGCGWTAVSNASWITITSGASGTGNGTVNYTVAPNTSTTPLSGSLTVAGQTITITEAAACSISATPASQSFGSSGGPGSVTVAAGSGCGWTAVSNASWITVTSGASGTGNGTVNYTVAPNTTTSSRSGNVTVGGQTVTVTEAGVCGFSASPTSQSVGSSGGLSSVTVTAGNGCGWTAVSNASWITVTSGASGSGNGSVHYTIAANTSSTARNGTLTVAGQTITVTEAGGCSFAVSPTSQSLGWSGGQGSVTVTAGSGCGWTAVSNVSWITVTSGASGTGNGTVNYTVASNNTTAGQTGTLTVAGGTITVTEAAKSIPQAPKNVRIKNKG